MPFIADTDNEKLVRELWPKKIGMRDYHPLEFQRCLPWERCPKDMEELLSWAYFTHNRAMSELAWKPFIFAHLSQNPYDLFPGRRVEEVTLRIQGFVEDSELDGAGNWDGAKETAADAAQSLTLGGGEFADVFAHQVEAVKNISELGKRSICPRARDDWADDMTKDGKILFRRKLFRQRVNTSLTPTSLNKFADEASMTSLESDVMDERKLVFRTMCPEGELWNTTSEMIRINDFVEVHTFVRVLMKVEPNGLPRPYLVLHPTAVVRLSSAREIAQILKAAKEEDNEAGKEVEKEVDLLE
ncbi:hypothetical protein BV25DRAFT_1915944 [Artomyces pyxidatus]|uniref:Uncharacterized protein n=1 Tax=Artomyces pyxidatus TaxID=48021 RepID=A0ACB8T2Q1_9AGAM|nr:hypothetical protein BV25DRAFT_1915944 [Artomyces pyxidatus]